MTDAIDRSGKTARGAVRKKSRLRMISLTSAFALACAGAVGAQAASASAATTASYSGTLADSAQWIAQVPADWNGTVVLYSHGFGPLTAADAPSPGSGAQLLAQGYALVGSSYDVNGSWWALDTAVSDQFGSLAAFLAASGLHPQRTLAVGTSMGGLINSLLDRSRTAACRARSPSAAWWPAAWTSTTTSSTPSTR